jgi:hypothetical protein
MGDLQLDRTNEGYSGTEIQAQEDFGQDYVFQANATHLNSGRRHVDGLHGFGYQEGRGVVGVGGARDPVDEVDTSDQSPQREGVFGRGGDVPQPGDIAGVGVRGIGGHGGYGVHGGIGVHGRGGDYDGHGVFGEGNGQEGSGVLGFSLRGRGATFGSGSVSDVADVNRQLKYSHDDVMSTGGMAQLRLVPSGKLEPPAAGRIGDLYVRSEGGSEVKLFLCVQSSVGKDTSPSDPAIWRSVLLDDPPVSGTP